MAKVLVMYGKPTDAQAFDRYYAEQHMPIARKIPGVRSVALSKAPIMSAQGPSDYHQIAILSFDSMADLQAGMGSSEGRAAAGDIGNFATGGATILIFDEQ